MSLPYNSADIIYFQGNIVAINYKLFIFFEILLFVDLRCVIIKTYMKILIASLRRDTAPAPQWVARKHFIIAIKCQKMNFN